MQPPIIGRLTGFMDHITLAKGHYDRAFWPINLGARVAHAALAVIHACPLDWHV